MRCTYTKNNNRREGSRNQDSYQKAGPSARSVGSRKPRVNQHSATSAGEIRSQHIQEETASNSPLNLEDLKQQQPQPLDAWTENGSIGSPNQPSRHVENRAGGNDTDFNTLILGIGTEVGAGRYNTNSCDLFSDAFGNSSCKSVTSETNLVLDHSLVLDQSGNPNTR